MKYHLITLGCQMNLSDSERVAAVLEKMGYQHTDNEEEANLVGMLACSVRQKPIDKVYNKIAYWNRQKSKRNLLTFLSGCVLPADKEKLLKQFDIIFPMSELSSFPDMVKSYGITTATSTRIEEPKLQKNEHIFDLWQIKPKYESTYEAFVPIQNGCDKFCTYCAVPYTRGREVSRPSAEIIQEVKDLVDKGYKSITLLGQNVNSYGLDKKGNEINFAELLRQIGKYGNDSDKDFWLYFTSPHPQDMTREVIEVIAEYSVLAKQINLPLQSGDEEVLQKMNRKHTMDKYREIVANIRELLPTATLFTDIIVGFTGESEDAFKNTIAAFKEFKFNMAFIAMYSPRPGAVSYKWEDEIDTETKKKRLHELTEEMRVHTSEYNKNMVGKKVRMLVTGIDNRSGLSTGLTEGKITIRLDKKYPELEGQIVEVEVTSSANFSLSGSLIEKL